MRRQALGLHVILNSGNRDWRSFHGLSGSSRAHGRFVVPMSIQPLAMSMPIMCMPWQVAQVRLVGIAEPHRVQVHRVADPERAEHEHVVPARDGFALPVPRIDRRVGRGFGSCFHVSPSGMTKLVMLLPNNPSRPAARLRTPRPGGPSGFHEIAGAGSRGSARRRAAVRSRRCGAGARRRACRRTAGA